MANRAWMSFGHHYSNHAMLNQIDCTFTVDATQGEGVSSLKSNGYVKSIQMHSSSPSSDNPNPGNGIIVVKMVDNYRRFLGMNMTIQAPLSGSDLATTALAAALTVGQPYSITVLGTNTAADWTALGVPAGITPAVGVVFIAKATGHGTGSGKVQASSSSGILSMELINSDQSELGPQGVSNQGAMLYIQCLDATGAVAAPAAGSRISLSILMDSSSVTVDGE